MTFPGVKRLLKGSRTLLRSRHLPFLFFPFLPFSLRTFFSPFDRILPSSFLLLFSRKFLFPLLCRVPWSSGNRILLNSTISDSVEFWDSGSFEFLNFGFRRILWFRIPSNSRISDSVEFLASDSFEFVDLRHCRVRRYSFEFRRLLFSRESSFL